MDIVGSVKEIADLAKKYNDIDFYRKIVELEGEVIELTRQTRQAEELTESLQKQIALKARMAFKEPFYFQEGDTVPFCPRCYEKDTVAVHLVFLFENDADVRWKCNACSIGYSIQKPGAYSRRSETVQPEW